MSDRNLTYGDLLEIVELIKSSPQFSEFHLKVGDIEIDLRRKNDAPHLALAGEGVAAEGEEAAHPTQRSGHVGGGEFGAESPAGAPVPAPRGPTQAKDWPADWPVIRSPMVGTFYRAPEPGARPFVAIGQPVEPDTTVCIIEVMKLMNSIPAGTRGVVARLLVEDAQPVEYGQALIVLRPR